MNSCPHFALFFPLLSSYFTPTVKSYQKPQEEGNIAQEKGGSCLRNKSNFDQDRERLGGWGREIGQIGLGMHPKMTNYLHWIQSHLVELHERFGGNIYRYRHSSSPHTLAFTPSQHTYHHLRYCGQDTEAVVKRIKSDARNSQNGGHAGGGNSLVRKEGQTSGRTYAQAYATLRRAKRRLSYFMNSGKLASERGTIVNNAIKKLGKLRIYRGKFKCCSPPRASPRSPFYLFLSSLFLFLLCCC